MGRLPIVQYILWWAERGLEAVCMESTCVLGGGGRGCCSVTDGTHILRTNIIYNRQRWGDGGTGGGSLISTPHPPKQAGKLGKHPQHNKNATLSY